MDSMNTTRSCYVYGILVISLELLMLMINNISNKANSFESTFFFFKEVKSKVLK